MISGPNPPPGPPSGDGDLAVIDTGGDIDISASNKTAGAEEIQIASGSTVTLSSGNFGAGADGEVGGMLIDEDSALILTSSGTMANQGSLDIVGLTGNGTLTLQQGAGFDDLGMIVGADQAAHGLVTVDKAFGFEVNQSGLNATDGVLVVGEDGDGTVDVSDTSIFGSAFAILGKNKGAVGTLTLDNSTWGGSGVTIGAAGVGHVTIESGAIVAQSDVVVGLDDGGSGDLLVNGASFGVDFLTIGMDGTGTATFEPDSIGTFATVTVGDNADAVANLTLNGSTWNTGSLTIGLTGTGHATAGAGEVITVNNAVFGSGADASGDLTVDGAVLNGGTVVVGHDGTGDLEIGSGSSGSVTAAIVGEDADSSGTLTIDGADWSVGSLTVGTAGTGLATVSSGSTVQTSDIVVGPNGELDATGGVGGPGTVIASTFTLEFGTLDVKGGGEVLIGASSGVGGAVSVDGTSSPLVGLGSLNGNVVLGKQGTVEATQAIPGSLFIDGNIHGTGTIEPLMTLEVNGGIDAGVDIAFSPSVGSQVGDLVLDVPAANLGTIVGFGAGNTIDVQGSLFTDAVFTQGTSGAAGTLKLSGAGFAPLSLAVAGKYSAESFVATPGASDTVVTLCFAAGTRIATPRGEVPVELLAVGDTVLTISGATRPIVWIGAGQVMATRGRRNAARPVIVRRGALANNVPHRDLRVTKGHSLFLDGVLIPVEFLINHRTIVWDDRAQEVAIYHVELATHDVLMADGAPAESYRDDGNRWLFRNANCAWHLPPQEPCAPVLTGGPVVDALWLRLLARARPRQDVPLTDDPDLHLLVDGRRVDAVSRDDGRYVFRLAARPRHVRISSRSGVPQELGLARDPRELGVALRHVAVAQQTRKRAMQANDVRLADGFHDFEVEKGFRWTNGDAAVPAELFAGFIGTLTVVLHVGATSRYLDRGNELRVA